MALIIDLKNIVKVEETRAAVLNSHVSGTIIEVVIDGTKIPITTNYSKKIVAMAVQSKKTQINKLNAVLDDLISGKKQES